MSEDPPKPPKPMKKTSAVPLKKETVRVTLKASGDEEAKPAAPAPTASKPGDKPPAPAPTIPLKTAGTGGPPKPAAPAPTVQLKTPGTTTAPKTTPLKTQPLTTPGDSPGGTQALPKATVQLGSATQALGAPTALSATQATIQTAVDEEGDDNDKVAGILSLVAFVVALAVLGLQLMTTSKWVDEADPVNGPGWNALFE